MLRREDDGKSVFGRFASQTHRGASAGRRKPGGVGAAFPRQRGLGQEGVGDVSTQRQLGAPAVMPARTAQQIHGGDPSAGGRMDGRTARSDVARTAVAAARGVATQSEYRSVVEPVAGDGAAPEKTLYAAELLYLPPYSPDFNPIEACWGRSSNNCAAPRPARWPRSKHALPTPSLP